MASDESLVKDVEEGEISGDSQSAEEIREENFKQEAKVSKPKGDSRVWMGDIMKYSVSNNYGSGLYNFAWAQAVQNKPFSEILMRDLGSDEKSKRSTSNLSVNSREDYDNNNNSSIGSVNDMCNVIISDSSKEIDSKAENVDEVEKEEGELEEGEIELDSEMIEETEGVWSNNSQPINLVRNLEEGKFENRIKSILEALGTAIVKDAEKSFNGICSELQTSLDSLQLMVRENGALSVDDLIQQSFTGIQAINSNLASYLMCYTALSYQVFCSMNPKQQEQNKDSFSRLLSRVKSHDTVLFSLEQMKEIEAMMGFLDSQTVVSSDRAMKTEKDIQIKNGVSPNELVILGENPGQVLNSSKKFLLEPIPVKSGARNIANMGFEIKPGLSGFRGRGGFGPLIDLHRDHDADSLPSPTRETPPSLPVQKLKVCGVGAKLEMASKVADESEDATEHPYETDSLQALSTYQQKFSRTSNILTSRLPSPTPSEEHDDVECDSNGEVSSSYTVGNARTANTHVPLQPTGSPTPHMDSSSGQGLLPAKTVGQLASGPKHLLRAPAKSRDPRLRFASSEVDAFDLNQRPLLADAPKSETLGGIISSRKNKIITGSLSDGQTLKRQRNGLANSAVSADVQMVSGSGGWLGDSSAVGTQSTYRNRLAKNMGNDTRKSENGDIGGNETLRRTGAGTTASLPSFLKDIAMDPTILMQLIMEQQQRLAAETHKKSSDSSQNTTVASSSSVIPGMISLVNVGPTKSSEIEQNPAGKPQVPGQTILTNPQGERGQIRMKPRDPRRILHSSTFQKNESLGIKQLKTNGSAPSSITWASEDNFQQGNLTQTTSLPSQSTPPDISQQFVNKLKNLADILSTSQATNTPTAIPHSVSSKPIPDKTEKADVEVLATDSRDQKIRIDLSPEESITGLSCSQNPWGDVEQLFVGYDDQQKADIQRERARRIEEQNKMFAARKLCLVLDLDHTLLNSAKFVEVDPVHDDILRKKEEQDREKPQRHLFRFPHMGMWTKLRPGIWNFLEKACKLYELHLYTMGNKLYATEMAKVLDPTGVLFAGRVISKGDDGDPFDGDEKLPKNKDLDGVLGMESAVVIIDDSVRVWPHNKLNLIVVERYTYFPCSRRQFGLLGPSLLEIDHDERPEDGTLASSLAVIERIHENFFSHQSLHDVDVRNVLASEQRKILAGCRIVFSRVFPVGESKPHLHPLWQTAEQFGAVCSNQIDEQVTHVVANSLGTDKVNWALSTGRFVVHPGWVEASALLYRRASEQDFAVKI